MTRKWKIILRKAILHPLLAIGIILCIPATFAAADDTESTGTDTVEEISFAGNYTRASLKDGNQAVYLSGGAWVETGNIYIEAESIDIYGEQSRFLSCRGNVLLIESEKEISLQSNILNYDRETSSLTINGWAELIDRKNELIVKGAYLKNEQETGIILIQINVSIIKATENDGEMYCKSDSALFDSDSNTLELTGNAEVFFDGSLYKASRIFINLNTNEITMEGRVSGTIHE
ncbi:MAG: hypothetical protein KAQ69_01120 [Spirochaetales bacterium]|nr:hypothetical protein [Spirochaetales bacterium]